MGNGWYILDENDQPVEVDVLVAAFWMEGAKQNNRRQIAVTEINPDCYLSTVFLGLDHSHFGDEGVPVLFESMWFGGIHDGRQDRYTSVDEARIGHQKMLDEYTDEANVPNIIWKVVDLNLE